MSRKAKIVLVCTTIAVAVVLTLGTLWWMNRDGVNSAPGATTMQPLQESPDGMPIMTPEQAERFAANLVSQDMASYRAAWAVDGELPPLAPKGTTMTVSLDTFKVTGDAATVNVDIALPGSAPVTCRLLLLYTTNDWRLVAMEEVK